MFKLNLKDFFSDHPAVKIPFILLIICCLQAPISLIKDLLKERVNHQNTAASYFSEKIGLSQNVAGPFLTFNINPDAPDSTVSPLSTDVKAKISVQKRQKGMFEVPIYKADLSINANFTFSEDLKTKLAGQRDSVEVAFIFSEMSGTAPRISIVSGDRKFDLEIYKEPAIYSRIYHIYRAKIPKEVNLSENINQLAFEVSLLSTKTLSYLPLAKKNSLEFSSSWKNVEFIGKSLPTTYEINDNGFIVNWDIISGGYQIEKNIQVLCAELSPQLALGVELWPANNYYRLIDRTLKYQLLFFVTTFLLIYLFEIVKKQPLHVVQYLFVGLSLVVFYFLVLALSEHIKFSYAYSIASIVIVLMLSGYMKAITSRLIAFISALEIVALYLFLYLAISSEGNALLVGTVGITLLLAISMYSTRKINWYQVGQSKVDKA